jgi:CubicO group peptidase (beta-lactamase class C family)
MLSGLRGARNKCAWTCVLKIMRQKAVIGFGISCAFFCSLCLGQTTSPADALSSGLRLKATPSQEQAGLQAAFDREIPLVLAKEAIASASIAVIKDGRTAFTAAYGLQSPGVPATKATLYNIASLTKPLTAEVVLRLASKGVLSLDEPMYHFWVDPDLAREERSKLLTPRFALSHRTGLPNWRDPKTGLAFEREPGTKWGYSGEGYQYVARFAEKKTGKNFEELAQSLLFGPMGMTSTSYTGKPWFEGRVAVPMDAPGKANTPTIGTHFNAADLVYTTSGDYAAFMVGVLDERGLTPEIARERDSIEVTMMDVVCQGAKAASCPPAVGFGLGWQVLAFKNGTLMMHTGKDDGVFTFAYLNRATRDGVVIFTNSGNGYKVILPVLELLNTDSDFLRFLRGQID